MRDERLDSLKETLQAAGFTGEVGVLRAGNSAIHNHLAPRTYHPVAARPSVVIQLDWPNGTAPTQGQRNGADAIIQSFDFRNRRPRSLAAIATDIQALSAADQRKLQFAVMAQFLIDNPRFAERLNIPISGDKPES